MGIINRSFHGTFNKNFGGIHLKLVSNENLSLLTQLSMGFSLKKLITDKNFNGKNFLMELLME